MKDYTCHLGVSTKKSNGYLNFIKNIEFIELFCLHVNGYLNKKKSFPVIMFILMTSGKCDFQIYFIFLQEI